MRNTGQGGFTLAEVLVALVVLTVALSAIMHTVAQSAQTSIALRDRAQALWVAQDRLTLHQLRRDWPGLDTATGHDEVNGRQWYWREKVTSSEGGPDLRLVDVEIRATEDGQVLAHLLGYLRRPAK